jgi:hypothetical protein
MGLGTHQFGWMPVTDARSRTGDRAMQKWSLAGENQVVRRRSIAGWTSALDTETLKALVEAGELSTAIN